MELDVICRSCSINFSDPAFNISKLTQSLLFLRKMFDFCLDGKNNKILSFVGNSFVFFFFIARLAVAPV